MLGLEDTVFDAIQDSIKLLEISDMSYVTDQDGNVFIGRTFEDMKLDETKKQFVTRTEKDLKNILKDNTIKPTFISEEIYS